MKVINKRKKTTKLREFLCKIRKNKKITLLQMAKDIKTFPDALSRMETGHRKMLPRLMYNIIKKYKLSDKQANELKKAALLSYCKLEFDMKDVSDDIIELFSIFYDKYKTLKQSQIYEIINILNKK